MVVYYFSILKRTHEPSYMAQLSSTLLYGSDLKISYNQFSLFEAT